MQFKVSVVITGLMAGHISAVGLTIKWSDQVRLDGQTGDIMKVSM